MFFGKGKAEKVSPDALVSLLNSSFDRKVGSLKSRTASIANELQSVRSQFMRTCDDFERLNAEPNTENLYFANVSFIKSQKVPYAQTLKRLASELVLRPESAANAYDECAIMTANVEEMLNRVLKANASFKQVVVCYSNHLSNFKKNFSAIEKLAKEARAELDKRADAFSEYRKVKEAIERYERDTEELLALRVKMESAMKSPSPGNGADEELRASEALAEKMAELTKNREELSFLRGGIASLTNPLDRASKKFDHVSAGKRQLHPFIEDPIGNASGDSDYGEFMSLVKELESSVESGAVDVKNKSEVVGQTSDLLKSDLRSKIMAANSAGSRISALEKEIRALDIILDGLREGKLSSERRARDAEELEARMRETEKWRDLAKSALEKLFSDHYGKALLIE